MKGEQKMRTDNINSTPERKTYKVVRSWFNSFAQNCYELEDGTKIYIDYGEEELTIEK